MLDESIEGHIKQKWTETISLEDAAANSNEMGTELLSYYGGLEISVKAVNKVFYVVGNVMVF